MAMNVLDEVRTSRYEARIAFDAETKADAYAVRYASYFWYGHIPENAEQLFSDRFDNLPNATTIVVYKDRCPVGSVRACMLRRGPGTTSPGREAFPDEVEALLAGSGPERTGIDGLEVNRLVRSPKAADDQALVFMLLRLVGRLGLKADFRIAVSCVRQNHLQFYRRLRFQEQSGPRPYPGLSCPMSLLSLPRHTYDAMRADVPLMNPEVGLAGALDGFEDGATVRPYVVKRS